VSVARHRDSDRGGGGGAHKPDTGVSEEDDHHSFEKENIWTIPNVLSLSRILLSPILGYQVSSSGQGEKERGAGENEV
jgi:hypothetical protein